MKTFLASLALLGLAFTPSYAGSTHGQAGINTSSAIYAQEDCKEGEKWNEETQKCEVESG